MVLLQEFEDPRTFVPPANYKGQVQAWGLFPVSVLDRLHVQ
jgi:hypothetical protein